jgi:ankyrin repeat protein
LTSLRLLLTFLSLLVLDPWSRTDCGAAHSAAPVLRASYFPEGGTQPTVPVRIESGWRMALGCLPDLSRAPAILTAQLLETVKEDDYRIAQFIRAAREGDVSAVNRFLAQGMDVNAKNKNEDTALMEACAFGRENVVEALLSKGADVNLANHAHVTAAAKAVMNGHTKVAVILVSKGRLALNKLLEEALAHGSLDISREILPRMNTPIHGSWLMTACRSGDPEVVKLVLDKGADPNFNDGLPLRIASHTAPVAIIQMFLDRGAQVDLKSSGSTDRTALAVACFRGREDVAKVLLDRGANIDVKVDKEGKTPLMLALKLARTEPGRAVVALLVSRKADVNARDLSGYTALHQACFDGLLDMVRLLVDSKADIESKDNRGVTPLLAAVIPGHVSIVRFLLERGANPNAKTDGNMTPLQLARKRGHAEVEKLLRQHGARN